MARTRQIKPEFFIDDELAKISRDARFLFIGLWTIADREGRLEDRPAKIKAQLFPYDKDITYQKVDAMLSELSETVDIDHKYIIRYVINNHKYIQIRTFSKHQRCHIRELASTIPGYTQEGAEIISTNLGTTQAMPSTNLGDAEHQPRCPASTSTSNTASTSTYGIRNVSAEQFTELPCTGPSKIFKVEKSYIEEMKPLYPGVDIEKETLLAKAWLINNPTHQKTYRGMKSFLGRWYARSQNKGNGNQPPNRTLNQREEGFAWLDEQIAEAEREKNGK